jgi:uncharacterized C2H2 Zn-finger protein
MNLERAVRLVRAHVEHQFPKTCPKCGRVFGTLADYLRSTRHVGEPISYDANVGDWAPRAPLGTFSLANCPCGTTISIGSDGMPLLTMWRLMFWARGESRRRGIAMRLLLLEVRDAIDHQVLAEPQVPSPSGAPSSAPKRE